MPLFSVVIPTYNRRERLARALRSVLAQRFEDFEIVVVDDGSTDGTAESLPELGGRLRLLRQANRGPASARNLGVRESRGDYVAFLDSDDCWLPWTLQRYAALLEAHGRPTWIYGRKWVDAERADPTVEEPCQAAWYPDFYHAAERDGLITNPTGVAVRRDVFLRLGGFAESLVVGEDFDFWFRIGAEPGFVVMDSPAAYVREHHPETLTEDVERSFRGIRELVRRNDAGVYPAGDLAVRVRHGMITRHLVFYAGKYVERARRDLALRFYLTVLRLQARAGFREPGFGGSRNRFLLSFPLMLTAPGTYRRLRATIRGRGGTRGDAPTGG